MPLSGAALTGDAEATDPTCSKSTLHGTIEQIVALANKPAEALAAPREWVYRIDPVAAI